MVSFAENAGPRKATIVASCQMTATLSNCRNFLRALITTLILKKIKGTRLIVETNSKNIRDWIICSQESKNMD
jgi:dTDP-D-glucose 4,6-dehydratase